MGPAVDPHLRLVQMLEKRKVTEVLDIGANMGQFAQDLREAGWKGRIISFEPIPDAWDVLSKRASRVENWDVAERCALSDTDGTASFQISGNSVSSSLLGMTDVHGDATPMARAVAKITVKTYRLETLWPTLNLRGPSFVKIDTQGSEALVLAGGGELLAKDIVGLQLEMSLRELYHQQMLADDLHRLLVVRDFYLCDLIPNFRDPQSGDLLQYDAVYFKTSGGTAFHR